MNTIKIFLGWSLAALLLGLGAWPEPVWGQRIRIPQTPTTTAYQGTITTPMTAVPVTQPPVMQPPMTAPPGTTLGAPAFDPYSTGPAAATPPSLLGPSGALMQTPTYPPGSPPTYPTPNGAYPNPAYAAQPPVLYPGCTTPSNSYWPQPTPGPYLKLFQEVRIGDTWLWGSADPTNMQSHDIEGAATLYFPNFLWTNTPIHVSPVFVWHLWSGPNTDGFVPPPTNPQALAPALPSQAYSGYISTRWQPKLTPMFGGDVEFNVGLYSDFSAINQDSLRLTGTGLMVAALTPTVTLKAGVTYLDRLVYKLWPAGGLLWTPNPQTRFDIYFPRPKLSQYLSTIGNTDVWWFIAGEYGGGTWTINRAGLNSGDDTRMDINDIRVGGGLEWTGLRGSRGLFEVAYVFNREIVFASRSAGPLSLDDTIMIRGGLSF